MAIITVITHLVVPRQDLQPQHVPLQDLQPLHVPPQEVLHQAGHQPELLHQQGRLQGVQRQHDSHQGLLLQHVSHRELLPQTRHLHQDRDQVIILPQVPGQDLPPHQHRDQVQWDHPGEATVVVEVPGEEEEEAEDDNSLLTGQNKRGSTFMAASCYFL
jgi:hypothetical protein